MTAESSFWTPAYIALGSNLEQPLVQVRQAIRQLSQLRNGQAMRASGLYRSAPMGPQQQPAYVNAVVGVLTQRSPEELLHELQQLEQAMGRAAPSLRWGPRIIDLDLLLFGASRLDTTALQLPHPGLLERNFVVAPLAEIAPQLILPNGATAADWARHLGYQGLERVAA